MIFQYQRSNKIIEVLNDLIRIHNDRIAGYNYALDQSATINTSLSATFEKIIADSKLYKNQLSEKIKELNGNPLRGTTIFGKIYLAWTALKVTFPRNTSKAIIAACLYNEKIALHVYNAALSSNLNLTKDICDLIQKQELELNKVYSTIDQHRELHNIADHRLTFFV